MFYNSDIEGAAEDIADFSNGLTCTITRAGVDYGPVACVITDFTFSEHAGRIIEYQDKKVLIAAKGLAIVPTGDTDVITFHAGGTSSMPVNIMPFEETIRIISNIPIGPDNRPIVHQLQVRR